MAQKPSPATSNDKKQNPQERLEEINKKLANTEEEQKQLENNKPDASKLGNNKEQFNDLLELMNFLKESLEYYSKNNELKAQVDVLKQDQLNLKKEIKEAPKSSTSENTTAPTPSPDNSPDKAVNADALKKLDEYNENQKVSGPESDAAPKNDNQTTLGQ